MSASAYRLAPRVEIKNHGNGIRRGWEAIGAELRAAVERLGKKKTVIAVECYPGADGRAAMDRLGSLFNQRNFIISTDALHPPERIDAMIAPDLTDDPVFGRITRLTMEDFFDPGKSEAARRRIAAAGEGISLVAGPGASLLCAPDILAYADLPRWEAQKRFRRGEAGNLGAGNRGADWAAQYKRAFFVDWRAADRLKTAQMERWDYWLDTVDPADPKMVRGGAYRDALRQTARRPFSVVPYFDPAPWGGGWMREKFGLDPEAENYGWCFNCVPEENSLLLDFGGITAESPSVNLVYYQPRELLGDAVYGRFGAEFPIRFDFLDTMGGGNLSFQVHPLTEYIRERFGMSYTQDESYYLMDAAEGACVYLGLREGVSAEETIRALREAQEGGAPFDAERYVNRWPAKKHDHFLIPAGTPHCSGRNSMVLEISATPYIFTFKLWDWGRLGLDGRPRPIHIQHGEANIQWDRTTRWTREQLINRVETVAEGTGWREERTGLHELEFIETRRHWFTGPVEHRAAGTVNVMCLVEGDFIVVESPEGRFEPFAAHYAETFIVPAAAGAFRVRPADPNPANPLATIKAYIRGAGEERHP